MSIKLAFTSVDRCVPFVVRELKPSQLPLGFYKVLMTVAMMVNPKIISYIQQNIVPQYSCFDKAHNLEHVNKVIQNSLFIAADYDVDIDKVYVVAAYHDVGLSQGRKNHEKTSAVILMTDLKLREWFSENELFLMSEAVEDHRASNDCEPRSIYGKIVSEADRDIEYMTILKRTIQYSLENYSEYNIEQHYSCTYEHIQNKYGEGGYLKLWLDTEINRRNLQELRKMITSHERLRTDFEIIFAECLK